MSDTNTGVRISNLTVRYGGPEGKAVLHDVCLTVPAGTCTAVVGESGSGKTTLGRATAELLPVSASVTGSISASVPVAYMPQDAVSALNPLRTVQWQISQVLKLQGVPRAERRSRSAALLHDAGINDPEALLRRYPHELSGGLAQRAVLATVLATNPRTLIADEPTSALDVSTQARVLTMFRQLVEDQGITLVVITHDLRAAARLADQVAVVHRGVIVECDTPEAVRTYPQHEYTQALVRASTVNPAMATHPTGGSHA